MCLNFINITVAVHFEAGHVHSEEYFHKLERHELCDGCT